MGNILSQDEVDSLLNGIGRGSVETEKDIPEETGGLEVYNFGTQSGPINMPALQMINERFGGFLRNSLSSATGSDVDVKLTGSELVKFNDFCRALPLPASINIFKMEPLRGVAMLVVEGPLVFSFVDIFFGGKGLGHVKLEGRAFTTIESKIIEKVTKITLGDLQKAWLDVHEIKIAYSHSEIDPQFAAIVEPSDMVIAIKFSITLGNESGSISICIPYSTVEPIREKLKRKFRGERLQIDERWRSYIIKKIRQTSVELNCIIGSSKISTRELLEMKSGDVIVLDNKISDAMTLNVEGVPKFKGLPGSYSSNKAIEITEKVNKE